MPSGSTSTPTRIVLPEKRKAQEATCSERPPKRPFKRPRSIQTPSSLARDRKYSQGLYIQLSYNIWECLFQYPKQSGACGKVLNCRQNLQKHIGLHAAEERKLIKKGSLRLREAVAIPEEAMERFVCELPDCGYLREYGKKYRTIGYAIETYRKKHVRDYHGLHEAASTTYVV